MKSIISAATALSIALLAAPQAHAVGCLSGAVVGGVAGHAAGHHGIIGAVGGCAVGHHLARQRNAERARQRELARQQQIDNSNTGSSAAPNSLTPATARP